jgi:hypothetical protein
VKSFSKEKIVAIKQDTISEMQNISALKTLYYSYVSLFTDENMF